MSDRKFAVPSDTSSLIDHYEPHIVTAQDYYPFGMLSRVDLPGSGKSYKFGFNGQEMNDDEVKGGLGNQQDYGMRINDPRIGRFLSVDPITGQYPELTPYQFASNSPIYAIDLDGLEAVDAQSKGLHQQLRVTKAKRIITVSHTYNQKQSSINLNLNGLNQDQWKWSGFFGNRPGLQDLHDAITDGSEKDINHVFSWDIASRNSIEGDYSTISTDGIGNTFRHFVMQAVATSGMGYSMAKQIGDLHEREFYNDFGTEIEIINRNLDEHVDLMNNDYARNYSIENKISFSKIVENNQTAADFLNNLVRHVLNSVPEYANDDRYKNLISGKEYLFNAKMDEVNKFRSNLISWREGNNKYFKETEKAK